MKFSYAIVVKSPTRLEALIHRFNTSSQVKFYLERQGLNYQEYEEEHEVFHSSLGLIQGQLGAHIKNKIVESRYVPSFQFDPSQLIVVVGQDGLVANTAKYIGSSLMIPVNPDPKRIDGVLLPHKPETFGLILRQALAREAGYREFRFAEVHTNDGQRLLGFNDLFIGTTGHSSARYRIYNGNLQENQSSSGIIVSTQAGMTGWMSSVFNMHAGINRLLGYEQHVTYPKIGDDKLLFAVREPFVSKHSGAEICSGILSADQELVIESMIPSGGKIFSDGVESDSIEFNTGSVAHIRIAKESMRMLYVA